MPATLLALQVFLILLPGFSAAYVVQALATRRSQSDMERVIEALVFSFVIYVCFIPLNRGRLPFHIQTDPLGKGNDTVVWEPAQLAWLAAVSVAFSLFAVGYIRFDGNRLFRFLRLTERTTCNSIWNDIFEREAIDDQPVQVELADGRSVLGILLYYSDTSEEGSVYLKDASWVVEGDQTVPIPGPGILLTRTSEIRSVSLLNPVVDEPINGR
ncbi:MAG: DUF6338 family protein [Terracidiphilus sp.]